MKYFANRHKETNPHTRLFTSHGDRNSEMGFKGTLMLKQTPEPFKTSDSVNLFFPFSILLLKDVGLYFCEDLFCSFWWVQLCGRKLHLSNWIYGSMNMLCKTEGDWQMFLMLFLRKCLSTAWSFPPVKNRVMLKMDAFQLHQHPDI